MPAVNMNPPTHAVNQSFEPQMYPASVEQKRNNKRNNSSMPVMNMIPTPGFNQAMQSQMDNNFYGQQGGANSNFNYRVPMNDEVANVPMHANVSTTTATTAFDSQSDDDAYDSYDFIDSPIVGTPNYDLSMLFHK